MFVSGAALSFTRAYFMQAGQPGKQKRERKVSVPFVESRGKIIPSSDPRIDSLQAFFKAQAAQGLVCATTWTHFPLHLLLQQSSSWLVENSLNPCRFKGERSDDDDGDAHMLQSHQKYGELSWKMENMALRAKLRKHIEGCLFVTCATETGCILSGLMAFFNAIIIKRNGVFVFAWCTTSETYKQQRTTDERDSWWQLAI